MRAEEEKKEDVPAGWAVAYDAQKRPYYWHTQVGAPPPCCLLLLQLLCEVASHSGGGAVQLAAPFVVCQGDWTKERRGQEPFANHGSMLSGLAVSPVCLQRRAPQQPCVLHIACLTVCQAFRPEGCTCYSLFARS